ncbi:MAG: tetratricopeptide repeat protein [Candidatus Heimdallarchaeota archaeon]
MRKAVNEEEIRSHLRKAEENLDTFQFKEAWDILKLHIEQIDHLPSHLAIDLLNGAGRARKWYKDDQMAQDLLERGLKRAKEVKYRHGEAFALNYLGSLLRDTGKPKDAIENYEAALEIWRELEKPKWIGNMYSNIAACYEIRGLLQRAQDYLEQAIGLHRKSGNKRAILRSTARLTTLSYYNGNFSGAIEYSKEAIELAKELGDKLPPLNANIIEGIVLKRNGKLIEAKKFFRASLDRLKPIRVPDSTKKAYLRSIRYNLAHTLELLSEYEEARAIYLELLEEEKESDEPLSFKANYGLGRIALSTGDIQQACQHLEDSISNIKNPDAHHIESLVTLSTAYIELSDFKKARKFLIEAQKAQIDSKYTETVVAFGEGLLAQGERNLKEARENFHKCLALAEAIGLAEYKIRALLQVAALDLFEYRISSSHESLQEMGLILGKAFLIAKEAHMPALEIEIGILKALSHSANLDYDGAIEILEDTLAVAESLDLQTRKTEIGKVLNEVRRNRERTMKSVNPDLSWNPSKVGDYLSHAQKLMRTYGKGREVT